MLRKVNKMKVRNRGFEKVSIDEFTKYYSSALYEEVIIPKRKTTNSAGYDFHLITDLELHPNEEKIIPTAIKAYMQDDEYLQIVVRSSLGFKYNIRLKNQIGIIDSDYYNNPDNEGHILVSIKNEGNQILKLKKGDAFVQGIFQKYLVVDDEERPLKLRQGGIGSTQKL